MTQGKISVLVGNDFRSKKITIPDNMSTKTYVMNLVQQFMSLPKSPNVFFFTDETTFYLLDKEFGIDGWFPIADIYAKNCRPSFFNHVLNDIESESKNGLQITGIQDIEMLQVHPEMKSFLPIDSEEKVQSFLDFVINTLNINYHPDDSFKQYGVNNTITDSDGNDIILYKVTSMWFDDLTSTCMNVIGDETFYQMGMEILKEKNGIITRQQFKQTIDTNQSEILLENIDGLQKTIAKIINASDSIKWIWESADTDTVEILNSSTLYPFDLSFEEIDFEGWLLTGILGSKNYQSLLNPSKYINDISHALLCFGEGILELGNYLNLHYDDNIKFKERFEAYYPFSDDFGTILIKVSDWISGLRKQFTYNKITDKESYENFVKAIGLLRNFNLIPRNEHGTKEIREKLLIDRIKTRDIFILNTLSRYEKSKFNEKDYLDTLSSKKITKESLDKCVNEVLKIFGTENQVQPKSIEQIYIDLIELLKDKLQNFGFVDVDCQNQKSRINGIMYVFNVTISKTSDYSEKRHFNIEYDKDKNQTRVFFQYYTHTDYIYIPEFDGIPELDIVWKALISNMGLPKNFKPLNESSTALLQAPQQRIAKNMGDQVFGALDNVLDELQKVSNPHNYAVSKMGSKFVLTSVKRTKTFLKTLPGFKLIGGFDKDGSLLKNRLN